MITSKAKINDFEIVSSLMLRRLLLSGTPFEFFFTKNSILTFEANSVASVN